MIVITGATGTLNGATVDHLLEQLPAEKVIVAVRDTGKAQRFAELGVGVRRGDYAEPASLPPRSRVPTSCCWCRPTTRVPMR
jgi:uncharacterized protein YbjT (DUF2867 family)